MVPISSQTEEIGPASDGETIKMPITALKHLAQTNFKTNFFLPASTKDVSRKERSKQVCNRGFFVSTVFGKHRGDLCFHFFFGKHRFQIPGDGLPPTDDWLQTFESMLFGGIDLAREPIDGSLSSDGKEGLGFYTYPMLPNSLRFSVLNMGFL